MDGIIIVNKPKGWTSFDVVARIRNLTGIRRVGHSGTLDPMATGVLPVFLGKATKSIQYFLNGDKGYNGEMILGVRTDTGDAEGKI
jgi:tRNA pseudouridine55 synthase